MITVTTLRRALAEPLVHFILLGGVIFAADAMLNPASRSASHDIDVSGADIERLRALAIKQFGAAPDAARLRDMVRAHVREEVLYRDAIAQGLDLDDVVIRRRLMQKWEFLSQSQVRTPTEAEARAYYLAHPDLYSSAERISFEHILFSQDRHAGKADVVAAAALHALAAGKAVAGDPSMLARVQALQSQAEVVRDFGAPFYAALTAATVGQWYGPYRSALGLHLVRVTARHKAQSEPFDTVQGRVSADLANQRLQQARDVAYEQVRQRYRIKLPSGAAP